MTTAIILLAIITVKATFALECPGNPWVGVGAEISTSITANNVECGDKDQTKYCERRIAAVVENCGHCTASVLLQKSYSLLGFVKCYSETAEFGCRIEIQGSIEVGCCGSLLCRGKLIAQADSRISIGSLSSVDITILNIGSRGSLIVGDGVSLTGNYMAKYEIGDDSTFALYSTSGSSQFEFTDSEIQTLDRNNFTYSVNGNVTLDQSHLIMSNSRVHIESESSSLSSFIADISSSDFHVVDTYLLVNTGNINLSGSLVDWKENSNVSLSGGTLIIMGNSAKWQITKSQMNLTSVLFNISNDSQLEINNCAFTVGGSERISFVLEHNSTLTINSGNTNALKCKITKSIVIPENARFTEADVSGLNCIKTARDTIALLDRDFDINNKREEKPVKPIFLNKPLHYDSCPIGGTPITQRNTVTPTTTTTATPPPTVTTSFANYMAGSIVVIIMSLLV